MKSIDSKGKDSKVPRGHNNDFKTRDYRDIRTEKSYKKINQLKFYHLEVSRFNNFCDISKAVLK